MNKTQKTISKKMKPFYEKHKTLKSFSFLVYRSSEDKICVNEEDIFLNDFRWDEIGNLDVWKLCIELRECKDRFSKMKNIKNFNFYETRFDEMIKAAIKDYRTSEPLLLASSEWKESFHLEISKSIEKHAKTEYPWKYIEYLLVKTDRDGSVEIEEESKR